MGHFANSRSGNIWRTVFAIAGLISIIGAGTLTFSNQSAEIEILRKEIAFLREKTAEMPPLDYKALSDERYAWTQQELNKIEELLKDLAKDIHIHMGISGHNKE